MTLKEALIDHVMTGETKNSIKVRDFQKVNKVNIKYIDVLQSSIFENSTLKEVK